MSKKLFGVNIKTANWVKGGDMVLFMNGVDEVVHLDGTDKTATKTIKEPQMVVYHAGESISLKELRANCSHLRKLAPKLKDNSNAK